MYWAKFIVNNCTRNVYLRSTKSGYVTHLFWNPPSSTLTFCSDPRNRDDHDEFNDDSIDDVFNHSAVTSPRNRDSSTPNSSPDTSPKKDEGVDGKESATSACGGGGAAGDDSNDTSSQITESGPKKAIVIVPSGQIVKETPEPSGGQEQTNDSNADNTTTNIEAVPMETEELPLSTGKDPAGGDTVSLEDVEISVEESRAGHYTNQVPESSQQDQTSPNPSSTATTNTSLSSSSGSGSGLEGGSIPLSSSQSSPSSSQSSSSTETSDTQLGEHNTDNLSNSNNLGNSTPGNSSSSSDNTDSERPAGGAAAASRPDSLPVEDFNSFTFWRDPLPEIDIDADLSPNSQKAAIKAAAVAASRAYAAAATGAAISATNKTQTSSTSEVTSNAEKLDEAAKAIEILSLNGGAGVGAVGDGAAQQAGDSGAVNTAVYVASVLTSLETEEETVTNIGSTHVLGQHPRETTMTVINGVVKGKLQRVTGSCFLHFCPLHPVASEPVVSPLSLSVTVSHALHTWLIQFVRWNYYTSYLHYTLNFMNQRYCLVE